MADELPITTDAPNQWIVFGRFDARAVAATKDAATAAAIGLIEYSPGAGPYSVWEYVSAARLTAAQEQVERLREALRREMVTDYYCEQCDRGWMEENVEIHAPGCLAAKESKG